MLTLMEEEYHICPKCGKRELIYHSDRTSSCYNCRGWFDKNGIEITQERFLTEKSHRAMSKSYFGYRKPFDLTGDSSIDLYNNPWDIITLN